MTRTSLNDVNIEAVAALTERIRKDAETARTAWHAHVEWKGAFRSEASVRRFSPLHSDEPAGLGGTDTAPNPVEQLLAALGNCLAVGYAANASALGVTIDRLSIDLEGDLDLHAFLGLSEGHAGYEAIRAVVDLSSDADPADLEELHRRVVGSSPVGHTLAHPVRVEVRLGAEGVSARP